MYDVNADLKEIEAAIVERVVASWASVQQVDEHGSCRINFGTSEVVVTYKNNMICNICNGKKNWEPKQTNELIDILNTLMEYRPSNPLAAIAHEQRIYNIKARIEYNIQFIMDWIKEM